MTMPALTPRQEEVRGLLDQGKSQAQVAELLGIAVRTVEDHVKAIRAKVDVRTTREAVAKMRTNRR